MPEVVVDIEVLRQQVRDKHRRVALDPGGEHRFHAGHRLVALLGYDAGVVGALPDRAVESFAGVGNPWVAASFSAGARATAASFGPTTA